MEDSKDDITMILPVWPEDHSLNVLVPRGDGDKSASGIAIYYHTHPFVYYLYGEVEW